MEPITDYSYQSILSPLMPMEPNNCDSNYTTTNNNNQKFYRKINTFCPWLILPWYIRPPTSTMASRNIPKNRSFSSMWRSLPCSSCECTSTRTCASRNSSGQYRFPADQHDKTTRSILRKQKMSWAFAYRFMLPNRTLAKRRMIYRCLRCGGNSAHGRPHLLACS